MKAGTTSLSDALSTHPDVYVCPIKEPNHFCTDLYSHGLGAGDIGSARALELVGQDKKLHHAYIREAAAYQSLFNGWGGERVIADLSTNYLYSRSAAENIRAAAPDAKIMMLLRNPVDRAFSEFLMNCSIGTAAPPLKSCLDKEQELLGRAVVPVEHRYVGAGLYYSQAKRYFDVFPREQIKVVLFDDLKSDFAGVMSGVADFLCIRPFEGDTVVSNSAIYPRSIVLNRIAELSGAKRLIRSWAPEALKKFVRNRYYGKKPAQLVLGDEDRARLRASFSEDLARLSGLIDRDLGAWHVN